jgi:hypothetical protein
MYKYEILRFKYVNQYMLKYKIKMKLFVLNLCE